MACYKIANINTPGSTLNLVIPGTSLTFKNGEKDCFIVNAQIPPSTTALPVYFQVGSATVPLYDKLGNIMYSDQLTSDVCIPGIWGTNPNHFKICANIRCKSMTTSASATIPGVAGGTT